MKKIFIAVLLCLLSLTLISCDKKTEVTKTNPVSSTTTTKSNQTTKPTTTLTNDELTDYYYKEMIKTAKSNKSRVAYYTFSLKGSTTKATIGIDLTEDKSGKLLFNFKLDKGTGLNPDISVILSLKDLENSETEDFLFVSVSKDVLAARKIEKEALDKDEYLASEDYKELKDIKYAVNMTSLLNFKLTDYIDIDLGGISSFLSTTIRGLLATILLSSNRTVGAATTNLIRTLTLIGLMDSDGKINIDRTADVVKTIIYTIKKKEYEGQTKKLLSLNAEINSMVDPVVKDLKERTNAIKVIDDETKTEFGYEFEITGVKELLESLKVDIDLDVDAMINAKLIFTQTKETGASNSIGLSLYAGAIKLASIDVETSHETDVEFDTNKDNYFVVDFDEVKALLDMFKQE